MRKLNFLLIFFLIFSLAISGQEAEETAETNITAETNTSETNFADLDIELGSIRIPRGFIHENKDYSQGIYYFTLTAKQGIPYFNVHTPQLKLLFEERAVVKSNKAGEKNFKYRMKKGFINRDEHFRIQVITPNHLIMAYFLVKK